ncbi:MAG: hypothetical protein ACRD5I_11280, partial [Candidatus Acidiferrales bacterium]
MAQRAPGLSPRPALLLLAVGCALLPGCSSSPEAGARGDTKNPIPVRIHPVEEQLLRRPVQAVGSLYAL